MTKNERYKLLFENWRGFVKEEKDPEEEDEDESFDQVPIKPNVVDLDSATPSADDEYDKDTVYKVGVPVAVTAAAVSAIPTALKIFGIKYIAGKTGLGKLVSGAAGKSKTIGAIARIFSVAGKGARFGLKGAVLAGAGYGLYELYKYYTGTDPTKEDIEELKKNELVKQAYQKYLDGLKKTNKASVSKDEKSRADNLWPLVKRLSDEGGVDPYYVMGIIHAENLFENESNNWGSGYMALTGIARKDVRERGKINITSKNKMDPETNIRAGIAFLKLVEKDLRSAIKRRVKYSVPESAMPRLILYAYNRGVGAVVDAKGVPIGSPGKGKKYKHAESKVFERGMKDFDNLNSFLLYAKQRYPMVLNSDYSIRALNFAASYQPPLDNSALATGSKPRSR